MDTLETFAIFEEKVPITPRNLANQNLNIQSILLSKLAETLEAKCSHHGWVVPNTLKLLSRSMGYVEKGRFTGDLVFHVQAQAKVLNPPSGYHLVCEVIGNNMMGMYVSYKVQMKEKDKKTKEVTTRMVDAIKIILPRDLHIGNEEFAKVQIGDRVNVEIKKSRFQVNDPYILSVGIFEGKVGSDYVAPVLEETVAPEAEEEGPSKAAALEVQKFEQEEEAAKPIIEENEKEEKAGPIIGEIFSTGEPIYFNAAKISEYRELDNRFPAPFDLGGKKWPTVEHYYQAMKFPDFPDLQEKIRLEPTAAGAAKIGKTKDPAKPIRADWKEKREEIMREAISAKFNQNPNLKTILLDTYPRPLVFADGNDAFWGYGRTRMGQNKLGNILMKYRGTYRGMEAINE